MKKVITSLLLLSSILFFSCKPSYDSLVKKMEKLPISSITSPKEYFLKSKNMTEVQRNKYDQNNIGQRVIWNGTIISVGETLLKETYPSKYDIRIKGVDGYPFTCHTNDDGTELQMKQKIKIEGIIEGSLGSGNLYPCRIVKEQTK